MARRRRDVWLFAVAGLLLGACGGDDSSPTGSGGATTSGGTGGTGGSTASGGSGGSTSGGAGGTGGDAGSGGASGSSGNPDAGPGGDGASDAPPKGDGGGGACLPAGTMSVVNADSSGYLFDNGPLNPVLTLCRGNKYTFVIDAPGHPIYIRQQTGASYTNGVTGNHISSGNLVFDVPRDAPNMLFYQCDIHDVMTGAIVIVD